MNDNTFIHIAKLYGYNIGNNVIEGMVFEKEELDIEIISTKSIIPNSVFTLSSETSNSNDIFAIYMNNETRDIFSIFAIQYINYDKNINILLDLLDFYDPLCVPDESQEVF